MLRGWQRCLRGWQRASLMATLVVDGNARRGWHRAPCSSWMAPRSLYGDADGNARRGWHRARGWQRSSWMAPRSNILDGNGFVDGNAAAAARHKCWRELLVHSLLTGSVRTPRRNTTNKSCGTSASANCWFRFTGHRWHQGMHAPWRVSSNSQHRIAQQELKDACHWGH